MPFVRIFISLIICLLIKLDKPEVHILTLTGLFIFIFFSIHFFTSLGKTIPLKTLMVVISSLQWIVGPFLAYHYFPDSPNYYMIVEEANYMPYVVFGEIAFIIGLFLFSSDSIKSLYEEIKKFENNRVIYKRGVYLLILGSIMSILLPVVPASLRFFFFLISYTKYVGVFYIFSTKSPFKWWFLAFAFSFEFINSFKNAMFHDLILWMIYIYIMYAFLTKITSINKIISLVGISVFVILIQTIKADYREVVWENKIEDDTQKIAFATDLATQELAKDAPNWETKNKKQNIVDRINQGWIIARIMYMVPHFEPFANGETIKRGLEAAVLPRILAPDKMKTGGKEYFPRFTGIILSDKTSMNLSIIGEAYANFGPVGGIIFMFLLGLFYNLSVKYLTFKAEKIPELLLWIPLIYFYTVRAESDFTTSINHIVKASLTTYILLTLINKIIPYQENIQSKIPNTSDNLFS
jgi:hypothetical protein